MKQKSFSRGLVTVVAISVAIALPVVAWLERYNIYDWWQLRNYSPPAAIAALAQQNTFTDYGRRLFYVNHPDLEDRTEFSNNCPSQEETIVLGCYIQNKGIFLFDVTDKRLKGVEEVTAAHETLHAAYDRLSPSERTHVDEMINKAYAKVTNKRIRSTIESYKKNGADTTNELHSILGTEVRSLPAELEDYYRQYFADRKVVVGYSEKYENEFTSRQDQVAKYDKQLEQMKYEIDAQQTDVDTLYRSLTTQRAELEQLRTSNRVSEYNAKVDSFNSQVTQYNAMVAALKDTITEYNDIVAQRNKVAVEEQNLAKSIDSRPTTIQSQ